MKRILLTFLVLCVFTDEPAATAAAPKDRPNIILIMVDDMGFSDLGCYGSEIETPHIDALAKRGVRFSRFYNNSRCCPTRATLLTGLPAAATGIGRMTNPPKSNKQDYGSDFLGYRGYLNRECVTIAEALKPAGYATLMTGKWHLGYNDRERWPLQRGFEKFYGCISGATRFFYPEDPRGITIGNEPDTELKSTTSRRYYTTDAFTDYAIRFIREEKSGRDRPFYLYLAYTAPHWPIQAHEEDIAKYRGKYLNGWEELRRQRYQKQIELGLIDPKWELSPPDNRIPAWDSLNEAKRTEMDLRMAVYAAMIDRVDQNVGKLLGELKRLGIVDNTAIMFLSDNGACHEGGILGRGPIDPPKKRNQSGANSVGEAWANASSTPFRKYKTYTHEGGAATPFLLSWPARIQPRSEWYDEAAHIIDIMPTILELSGAEYPTEVHGSPTMRLPGISLRPAFDGKRLQRIAPICSEHIGHAFVMDRDWKLVGSKVAGQREADLRKWELYNLSDDRTELNDLAKKHPERVRQMSAHWQKWADANHVYPRPKETRKK